MATNDFGIYGAPITYSSYHQLDHHYKGYVMDNTNTQLTQFVQQTGAPITVARKYIYDYHGDVGKAVSQYRLKQSATNTPGGNIRNKEMKPPSGLTRQSETLPPGGFLQDRSQSNNTQRNQVISYPQKGPQKVQECHVSKITIGKPNAGGGVPMTPPQATTISVTKNVIGSELPKAPASPSNTSSKMTFLIFIFAM